MPLLLNYLKLCLNFQADISVRCGFHPLIPSALDESLCRGHVFRDVLELREVHRKRTKADRPEKLANPRWQADSRSPHRMSLTWEGRQNSNIAYRLNAGSLPALVLRMLCFEKMAQLY
jgi:hypothetical protein